MVSTLIWDPMSPAFSHLGFALARTFHCLLRKEEEKEEEEEGAPVSCGFLCARHRVKTVVNMTSYDRPTSRTVGLKQPLERGQDWTGSQSNLPPSSSLNRKLLRTERGSLTQVPSAPCTV